jgi:hypothetical protein
MSGLFSLALKHKGANQHPPQSISYQVDNHTHGKREASCVEDLLASPLFHVINQQSPGRTIQYRAHY